MFYQIFTRQRCAEQLFFIDPGRKCDCLPFVLRSVDYTGLLYHNTLRSRLIQLYPSSSKDGCNREAGAGYFEAGLLPDADFD